MSDERKHPLPQGIMAFLVRERYRAGQRLPSEFELASRFEVGRSTVREALRALEALGFVEARRGSGRVLRPFDFAALRSWLPYMFHVDGSNLLDLLRVRQVLEVNFLSVAANHLGRGTLNRLRDLAETMVLKAQAGESFVDEDYRFHEMLHEEVGNTFLTLMIDLFWDAFATIPEAYVVASDRLVETARQHVLIAEALLAGDTAKAQYYMDAHFYDVAERLSARQSAGSGAGSTAIPDVQLVKT